MTAVMPPFRYSVFGLRIASGIPLPELTAACGNVEPDVVIEEGQVLPSPGNELLTVNDQGEAILTVPGIARYQVAAGRRIRVEADGDAPARNVRLYLLGSALGMLLHQRGLFPLHANAIIVGGKAITFMGPSGEGKSTLAAWFQRHGYPVLTDDVSVMRLGSDEPPEVCPGVPRLRLWRDALESFGHDPAEFARSYRGDDNYEKFDVPLPSPCQEPVPLAAICLLGRASELEVRQLGGVEAAEALFSHTYRGSYVRLFNQDRSHWESSLKLIRQVPVLSIKRPRQLTRLADEAAEILELLTRELGLGPDADISCQSVPEFRPV